MKKFLLTTAVAGVISFTHMGQAFAGGEDGAEPSIEDLQAQVKALTKQVEALTAIVEKQGSELNQQNAQISNQGEKIAQQEADFSKLSNLAPAGGTGSSGLGDVKISMKPGPKIESHDGKYSFQPFGRLHIDFGAFSDDVTDHPDGANFRRARLGFKGKVAEDWGYKAQFDFAKEGVAFKDVYISYDGFDAGTVKVGHFKPSFSLENLTSANYITFIERAAPVSFAQSEQIGIGFNTGGDNWSAGVGVFNDDAGVVGSDDEMWSFVGRGTFAPMVEDNKVVHLGAAVSHRLPNGGGSVTFSSAAENGLQTTKSVSTGAITADSATIYGLEAAGVYGPFSLQGEYMMADVDRPAAADADFSGWYGYASYFLTGESRPYKASAGKFGRVKPKNPLDPANGGWGAFEVAVRASNLDLNDSGAGITGGEMDNYTAALNWYFNDYVRLMFNYIKVDTDSNAPVANDDPDIFLVRAQVNF